MNDAKANISASSVSDTSGPVPIPDDAAAHLSATETSPSLYAAPMHGLYMYGSGSTIPTTSLASATGTFQVTTAQPQLLKPAIAAQVDNAGKYVHKNCRQCSRNFPSPAKTRECTARDFTTDSSQYEICCYTTHVSQYTDVPRGEPRQGVVRFHFTPASHLGRSFDLSHVGQSIVYDTFLCPQLLQGEPSQLYTKLHC
jgi:hypothetical protein